MKIRVLAVGRSMPGWVEAGWNDYVRRLPRQLKPELEAVAPAPGEAARARNAEGRALLKRCGDDDHIVALDGGGRAWSTQDLAGRLDAWMMGGRPVSLLVGGAGGHEAGLLAACDQRWSLGPLTLPHMLVRVIVAEQLYRAWTMISGHPYHRG